MENCQLIRIRIGNFLSQLIRIRISFPQKDRTPNNNNRYQTSLMVHMKSELVTVVSAKTILNRATGGSANYRIGPKSVTGHSLNVKFDSNFYRANYYTN